MKFQTNTELYKTYANWRGRQKRLYDRAKSEDEGSDTHIRIISLAFQLSKRLDFLHHIKVKIDKGENIKNLDINIFR